MNNAGHFRRLADWDYGKGASFFITLALESRRPLFGEVKDGRMELSPFGAVVQGALEAIPRLNPGISLFGHIVMPDHVHFNCHLAAGLADPLKTLGEAVRRFKHYTTKRYALAVRGAAGTHGVASCALWRRGYHDHLCLSSQFIESTERYIAYNPLKWWLMHGKQGFMRIREPLDSPRLDPAAYWKGVGNTALLDPAARMVSLRVSMKVRDTSPVVARMERAVEKGWTVISGFISKGERDVLEMLLSRKEAKIVRMRPTCIPNAPFRPESAFVDAFAQERCLELGRGNDEIAFGRDACLDMNDEIVRIATSGNGVALHWREDGPHARFARSAR